MDNKKQNITELENILDTWRDFTANHYETKTFALLYAFNKCWLGRVDKAGNIEVKDSEDKFDIKKVFEARIFNKKSELRWLKGFDAKIITDELFESDKNFVEKFDQSYLLWGKSLGKFENGWTQFGTARIGNFYVPETISTDYAQITVVEYLKEFKDGNVAVFEERLLEIIAYQLEGGTKNA